MASLVTANSAPRDFEGLKALKQAVLFRVALDMKLFPNNSPEEKAFMALDLDGKAEAVRIGLTVYDAARTEGHAPPPPAPPVVPAAVAMQPSTITPAAGVVVPKAPPAVPVRQPSTATDPGNAGAAKPGSAAPTDAALLETLKQVIQSQANVQQTQAVTLDGVEKVKALTAELAESAVQIITAQSKQAAAQDSAASKLDLLLGLLIILGETALSTDRSSVVKMAKLAVQDVQEDIDAALGK